MKQNTKSKTIKKTSVKTNKKVSKHGSFVNAIIGYWRGYFDFKGVASRKDYWWVVLFVFLLEFLFALIDVRLLSSLLTAVLFFPSRAIAFRRYHDVGLSGLFNLIPYLLLFIWAGIRSEKWSFFLNLEYFPTDLKIFLLISMIWGIFNLIVVLKKSKLKNNIYRK